MLGGPPVPGYENAGAGFCLGAVEALRFLILSPLLLRYVGMPAAQRILDQQAIRFGLDTGEVEKLLIYLFWIEIGAPTRNLFRGAERIELSSQQCMGGGQDMLACESNVIRYWWSRHGCLLGYVTLRRVWAIGGTPSVPARSLNIKTPPNSCGTA